ncbi:E3 ubiquitin-protein ligase listerin isoform X2 [Agrilus planipennis]|nr:E3 ubiquitin-protein ligase listerin isoform X2 [Agrilus planipennis]
MKVVFTTESHEEQSNSNISKSNSFSESYLSMLDGVILNVCKSYVKFINEKKSRELLQYLYVLLQDFESKKFFEFLNAQVTSSTSNSLLDIFEKLLAQWLKDDQLSSVYVIDLIFLLLKHANVDEKIAILDSLLKISDEQVFSWCLQKSLSFPYKQCPILQKWLKKPEIGAFFVEISKRIVVGKCSPELSLILKQTLEENEDEELFISDQVLQEIINTFVGVLLSPLKYSTTLDVCVRFCAHIAGAIYTEKYKLSHGSSLLLSLFRLSCLTNCVGDSITSDTVWEMKNVWQDVVSMLSKELSLEEFKFLFIEFSDIIEDLVLNRNRKEDFDLGFLVDKIILLVKSIHSGNSLRISDALHLILKRDFLNECEKQVSYLCKKAEYVKGRLSCPYEELAFVEMESEFSVSNYFFWSHLTANIFTTPLPNKGNDDDDDDEEGGGNEELGTKIIEYLSEPEEFVIASIYSIALAKSFVENFKNTKYFEETMQRYISIKQTIKDLIQTGTEQFRDNVEESLCKKTMQEGWIWAEAIHLFYSEIRKKKLGFAYIDLVENYSDEIDSEISVVHLGQVFSESLTYDHVSYDLMPLESVICLRSLLHCDEIDVQIAEVFGKIDKFKADKKFLLQGDSFTWKDYQILIEVIRLMSSIIEQNGDLLSSARWDFTVVAYTTWLENVLKMNNQFKKIELEALLAAMSNLFVAIRKHILYLYKQLPYVAKATIDEWKNLFAADVHRFNIELWLHFVEYYQNEHNVPLRDIPLLQEFGKLLQFLDYNCLFSKKDAKTPKWTKLVEKCCSLLTHPLNTLQLWSYNLLMVLLPGLVDIDSNSVNSNTPHATGLTIEHFKTTLIHTEEIVHSMLLEFRLGEDSCTVQPFTDSYSYTFSYLLLWDVILCLCNLSSTELRYQYADWIKNNDFLTKLLNNLFRLMPTEVLHQNSTKVKPYANLFLEKFSNSYTGSFLSLHIEHMVCWTYYQTLSQLPALVRQWWSVTESKVSQIVERVTSVYVSPTLCSQELSDVIQHEKKFKNMTVKVYPNVREVVAIYTVDEAQMELLITLPPNYPLKVPDIQCNRQICGTSHRQWILQLKTNVLHQNGRIWDGLSLWNNNLDKKFEGVEECYICFAVLHQGTYQLPKLSCSTCRKKFHSACLYKWFSTSNKSTCPICRNLF